MIYIIYDKKKNKSNMWLNFYYLRIGDLVCLE